AGSALADRATFERTDLAFAEDPAVQRDPHAFISLIDNPDPLVAAIARGAQVESATFFASDGQTIIHPEPARFFEVPIHLPLPEDLNYIPCAHNARNRAKVSFPAPSAREGLKAGPGTGGPQSPLARSGGHR